MVRFMLNLGREGRVGITKQEEKEKEVLGELLLPLPLTPREEAWTTEEAWKGTLKGRFPLWHQQGVQHLAALP